MKSNTLLDGKNILEASKYTTTRISSTPKDSEIQPNWNLARQM